jgi:hypothetical protein
MKADWDKLGAKYANSESVMIVDADCTGPAQSTCGSQGVKGYPTIKYYIDGKAKDYQGGRDFGSLDGFVKKTLDKASCDVKTQKGCKGIQKKFIDANSGKSKEELQSMKKERQAAFKQLEKEFKEQEKAFKVQKKKYKLAMPLIDALIKNAGPSKDEL